MEQSEGAAPCMPAGWEEEKLKSFDGYSSSYYSDTRRAKIYCENCAAVKEIIE